MKTLSPTEIKAFAKSNNLKISGSLKKGYTLRVANSFQHEDIRFDIHFDGKENWIKTMSILCGAKTIQASTGEEYFKHWAHLHIIDAENTCKEADAKPGFWSEYMGYDEDYSNDDYMQNAWDTTAEHFKLPVNEFFTDYIDYVKDIGSEEAEEEWYNRPI